MRKKHAVAAVLLASIGFLTIGCHPVSKADHDALASRVGTLEQELKSHRDTSREWAIQVTATLNFLYACHDPGPCPGGPGIKPPPPPGPSDW